MHYRVARYSIEGASKVDKTIAVLPSNLHCSFQLNWFWQFGAFERTTHGTFSLIRFCFMCFQGCFSRCPKPDKPHTSSLEWKNGWTMLNYARKRPKLQASSCEWMFMTQLCFFQLLSMVDIHPPWSLPGTKAIKPSIGLQWQNLRSRAWYVKPIIPKAIDLQVLQFSLKTIENLQVILPPA